MPTPYAQFVARNGGGPAFREPTATDTAKLALWCELRDAMTTAEHGAPSDAGARLLDAMAEYVTSRAQGDDGLAFAYLDHVAQVCHMAGARLATVQA